MARTAAKIGQKSRFGIKGAGDAITYLAEVTAITPPGRTREAIEATHLESDDDYKEFIAGLKETGEASITLNFIPSATDALVTAFESDFEYFRILFPSGTVALDFGGFFTAYDIGELTGDKMTATCTIKASGKAALTAVSGS